MAILGILGLAMAIIVIGRGIDISMVAVLAVPAGLVLQLVQDGHSVPMAFVAALALALVFGLVNGWLVAYAEVPSLFTTLASGLFLAGLGQVAFFRLDIVQWSPQLDQLSWVGRGTLLGVPMPVIMFAVVAVLVSFFLRRTRLGTYVYAVGDNPFGARVTGIPTRPVIVLQYVLSALIGTFAGMVMAASVASMKTRIYNSTLIYDVILVVVLGGIGLSGGRGGVRQRRRRHPADRHPAQRHDDHRRLVYGPERRQGRDPSDRDRDRHDRQSARRADRSAGRHLSRALPIPRRRPRPLPSQRQRKQQETDMTSNRPSTRFGTALAAVTLLAGLCVGQAAWAQGKGIDEPSRDPYRKTLSGKTVAYVPVAIGFDLAQGWADGLKEELEPLGVKIDVRDPNWSTDAGAQAITSLITEKPDVIVVHNPDVQSYAQLLQEGRGRGHLRRAGQHALELFDGRLRRRRLCRDGREGDHRRRQRLQGQATRSRSPRAC